MKLSTNSKSTNIKIYPDGFMQVNSNKSRVDDHLGNYQGVFVVYFTKPGDTTAKKYCYNFVDGLSPEPLDELLHETNMAPTEFFSRCFASFG